MENITVAGLLLIFVTAAIREIMGFLKQKSLQNSESRLKAVEENMKKLQDAQESLKENLIEAVLASPPPEKRGVKRCRSSSVTKASISS